MSQELELLRRIKKDLLMRGETDSKGFTVVDLGATLWRNLCERIDEIEKGGDV